jgi:hypothetical protein
VLIIETTTAGGVTVTREVEFNFVPVNYYDLRIIADEAGRWKVQCTPEGGRLDIETVAEGTFIGGWSGTWTGGVEYSGLTPGMMRVKSVVVEVANGGSTSLQWATQESPVVTRGDLPRLAPGATASVVFRGGEDHRDALTSHAPSSVAVSIIPLYLNVPA